MIAYLIVFITYLCIDLLAIVFMFIAAHQDNAQVWTISSSIAVAMSLINIVLLFVNRRVCWLWCENGVLKRKWLLLGKTEIIHPEQIETVSIAPDGKKIYMLFAMREKRRYGDGCMEIPNNALGKDILKKFWHGDVYSYEPCDACKSVEIAGKFHSPSEYFLKVSYLKALLESGNYEMEFGEHPLDALQDENGRWVDDMISHAVKCKKCGAEISLFCDTYHGRGNAAIYKSTPRKIERKENDIL